MVLPLCRTKKNLRFPKGAPPRTTKENVSFSKDTPTNVFLRASLATPRKTTVFRVFLGVAPLPKLKPRKTDSFFKDIRCQT